MPFVANVIILFVFGAICLIAQANHKQECITPDQKASHCISVDDCPSIKSALLRIEGQNEIDEVNLFVNRSTCFFDSKTGVRFVCCPRETQISNRHAFRNDSEKVTNPKFRLPDPPECGVSHNNESYNRIIGGFDVSEGQFPWIVVLTYKRENVIMPTFECGGVLVHSNFVLTAGHCVFEQPLIGVRIGVIDLYQPAHLEGKIVGRYIHEKYKPKTLINDIALLKIQWKKKSWEYGPFDTDTEFVPAKGAGIICLPKTKRDRTRSYENYTPFVAGWGFEEWNNTDSQSQILKAVQIKVTPRDFCKEAYKEYVTRFLIWPSVMCAGYVNSTADSCTGDSGGPLMLAQLINGTIYYYSIGIVSKGYHCAVKGMPGIYTRVGNFISWIVWAINKKF